MNFKIYIGEKYDIYICVCVFWFVRVIQQCKQACKNKANIFALFPILFISPLEPMQKSLKIVTWSM